MSIYIESLLIYLLCAILYPIHMFHMYHAIIFLVAITLLCAQIIKNTPKYNISIGVLLLLFYIFFPEIVYFVPVFSYVFFYRKKYVFPIIYLFLYFINPNLKFTIQTFFFILTFFISLYLAHESREKDDLKLMIKHLRDTSAEQEIKLKKQNQQLIENQNDELYIATLQERNRIAREIHDNVGHMLSRSILQLGALLTICKDTNLKPHLETLKDTLNEAMTNIRNSVHDLHDEAVHLEVALKELIQKFEFCPVKLTCNVSKQIPKNVKYCFLSIVKEALNNTMKHSNATNVSITVKEHYGFYQLIIQDNGTNIPSDLLNSSRNGIGLTSMKERVMTNNGIIHITTENGFRIFITIPK